MTSGKRNYYSQTELDFLRDNCTLSRKDLTDRFNAKFARDIKQDALTQVCLRNGWITGRNGCFEKGNVAWNYGMKGYYATGIEKTWFKKGYLPWNTLPLGSERVTFDGYIEVKTSVRGWKLKHRLIWEQANGKIPEGYLITFKDGNSKNTAIDNLEIQSKELHAVLCKSGYYQEPKELKPIIRTATVLRMKLNEIEKCPQK